MGDSILIYLSKAQASFPPLFNLGFSFCYVAGIVFVILGIFGLKEKSSGQQTKINPLVQIFIGILLYYVPEFMDTVGKTIFGEKINPLDYNTSGFTGANTLGPSAFLIKLIGFFSFIKGCLILRHVGSSGQKSEEALSKGVIHCVGGVAAFHLKGTLLILSGTFGLDAVGWVKLIIDGI